MKSFLPMIALSLLLSVTAFAAAPSEKEVKAAVDAYLATKADPATQVEASAIGTAVADLDKDGAEEIIIAWSALSGSSSTDSVTVLTGKPGSFKEAAIAQPNGVLEAPAVKGGEITVPAMTFAKEDALCCPSVKKTYRFKWDGKSKLEEAK
ncbi:MAG TPA: hypothetical protein VEF76_02425 [Patescibacteria group bacterium]|nr:hypothetical protein [Patescibacteria group bacterium]